MTDITEPIGLRLLIMQYRMVINSVFLSSRTGWHALNLSSGVGLALKISLKDGHVVYEKHDISITCVCNF